MSDLAIRGEKLGKRFHLGEWQRYRALRDVLAQAACAPWRLLRGGAWAPSPNGDRHIWALRDASFEVRAGEVVGVIGRNGAGKSTLLKILARVTKPTEGFAKIHGRLGSLLEVGTGFHPELSGRENVYLSGAILGMTKREIVRKFDEMVAFAEVEKFIDTPLKHFSTGMQMRLAFAVAAHLEPEILLVDEVLAVGDAAFQKKCLNKMSDVARGGRTILFVSHHMNQIRRLCQRVMWIDNGKVREVGPTAEVSCAYETAIARGSAQTPRADGVRPKAQFQSWEIVEPRASHPHQLNSLGPVTIKITVQINKAVKAGHHGVSLFSMDNQLMWGWAADDLLLMPGLHELYYTFPTLPLRPGPYSWHVTLWEEGCRLDEWLCLPEMIIGTAVHQHARDEWNGVLNLPCKFVVKQENHDADAVRI
jgi:homopolymeric O-antigen transport system ATP-binding protein